MIKDISIPEELKNQYHFSEANAYLTNLNRINIFIGPNNSGKSRFMRELFHKSFSYRLLEIDFDPYNQVAKDLLEKIARSFHHEGISDVTIQSTANIKATLESINQKLSEAALPIQLNLLQELNTLINNFKTATVNSTSSPIENATTPNHKSLAEIIKHHGHTYDKSIPPDIRNYPLPNFEKVYIPILRGIRPIQFADNVGMAFRDTSDNYKKRTIKDYFPSGTNDVNQRAKHEDSLNIFSGLSLYSAVKNMLLGSLKDREKIRSFEMFLSTTFFDSSPVSLTPRIEEDCLYITIGEEDRPIYEMGDGIQNIIILTYPLFFNSDKHLLCFIEEPELSLHPGMQRIFVDTIVKDQFKNIQFFFTTHSNHFLDMTLDHQQISIFSFKKEKADNEFRYTITNTRNEDISLLNSIGVQSSSVFLSNCTIWVEGITDRLYINKFMEVFQLEKLGDTYETNRLKEDLHYSFIEYGGINISHYAFENNSTWKQIKASKISSKIMVIVDEDGTNKQPKSAKSARIKDMKNDMGDHLLVLPCREIENSLSANIIKSVIQKLEGNSTLTFNQFTEAKYRDQYLGAFITKNVSGLKRKYIEKDGSGTLNNKVSFCREAISQIKEYADLSNASIEVAEKVYNFIKSQNI